MARRLTSDGSKVSDVKSVNGLTCSSDNLTRSDASPLSDVQDVIAERQKQRVEEASRRREASAQQRQHFAAARKAGLQQRHANKGVMRR